MKMEKLEKLESAFERWKKSVEIVDDDFISLFRGFNITKSTLAKDIDIMKARLSYIERLLKS